MNTMVAKEKPDLLFNNPLKQKVYVFLKNNPGKDFETFQVFTGDAAVSRQQFREVEQAIQAREERERSRGGIRDVNVLFLHGPASEPQYGAAESPGASHHTTAKELPLRKIEKKKMNERAKKYIIEHPDCTYGELVKDLGFGELSKPHFFSMKTLLRKKGSIPGESRTRRGRKAAPRSQTAVAPKSVAFSSATTTIEILESIDATGFSDELREHYKSHVLPLLQKLLPGGKGLQMVLLSDPPTIELRRNLR